jgi:hypothetical protein
MASPLDASVLEGELGAKPPRGLVEVLTTDELRTLVDSLVAAKQHQSKALDDALQDALRHVPFILRGTVELILT